MATRPSGIVTGGAGGAEAPRSTLVLGEVAARADDAVSGSPVARSFQVGGRTVRLEFAGDALVDKLTRALRHLPAGTAEPDLTIRAWDTASTGMPGPTLPPDDHPDGPTWRRVLVDDPPLHAVYKPGAGSLSVVDRSRRLAWYWCADAGDVPVWEQGTPFLHVFHHWLSSVGLQLVHAGAAGDGGGDGGVLFVGKSGSGKSTATLASVVGADRDGGLRYAGDDYVVVGADPDPVVHALYSSGKLDVAQLVRFPELGRWVENPDGPADEKRVFFLADHRPEWTSTGFPLRAVVLPRVAGRPGSSLEASSPAAALAALAPSTIFQMPGAAGAELKGIAAVLRRVPAWRLHSGTDLAAHEPLLRELLTKGRGA
ncbi:MAG: serine kinase [Acidimicrobiia bacterium]